MGSLNEPVKPGHIKLVKLQREGVLQSGDVVETAKLGQCTVAFIRSGDSICVKRPDGSYFNLSGFGWAHPVQFQEGAR